MCLLSCLEHQGGENKCWKVPGSEVGGEQVTIDWGVEEVWGWGEEENIKYKNGDAKNWW